MKNYHVRTVAPHILEWGMVEGVDVADAVQAYHYSLPRWSSRDLQFLAEDGHPAAASFCTVEVKDEGEYVSRIWRFPLVRKGGVLLASPPLLRERLEDLATTLGWTKPPWILMDPGWEGEDMGDKCP
jgi:hypothetical protein